MSKPEIIAGIDLGTTNSSIAILENGMPRIIEIEGSPSVPSCVSIDEEGDIIVGKSALNQAAAKPDDTHFSIKRHMGSDHTFSLGGKDYRAEELSAFILRKLRDEAQAQLDQPVKKAVITVPAYFNDDQRLATKNAAELAGIECVRLLNEPTAAALAYNPESDSEEEEKILVYDLGGGTFDVSLVTSSKDLVEVIASHGDTHLGGDDVDDLLIDYVIENSEILNDRESLTKAQLQRLRLTCEAAKRVLSDHPSATISEEYFLEKDHLNIEIFRNDFNEKITPLLEKTWTAVHASLHDAGIVPTGIDKILLVGGSTHMPVISDLMEQRLGIAPQFDVNPDLIVTMGAAIQAGIIAGEKVQAILIDISAHTYSTGALSNMDDLHCVPIIKKGTPLPAVKSDLFFAVYPDQDVAKVEVYQGESKYPDENHLIDEFLIEDLNTSGSEDGILCEYALDLNGILKVTATEKSTGKEKSVVIDTRSARQSLDLAAAKEKMAELYDEELPEADNIIDVTPSNAAEDQIISKGRKILESDSLSDEDRSDIESLLKKIDIAKKKNSADHVASAVEKLDDILFYIE